jgi:hypothetical protein
VIAVFSGQSKAWIGSIVPTSRYVAHVTFPASPVGAGVVGLSVLLALGAAVDCDVLLSGAALPHAAMASAAIAVRAAPARGLRHGAAPSPSSGLDGSEGLRLASAWGSIASRIRSVARS